MHDLAEAALADPRLVLARVVTTTGMGSGRPVDAALFDATGPVAGTLLSGAVDEQVGRSIAEGAADHRELLDLHIGDDRAHDVGLTCGGHATVLVQPASDVPAEAWQRLAARTPVAVVTALDDSGASGWLGLDASSGEEALATREVRQVFARGSDATASVDVAGRALVVTAVWPTPSLLVVGEGLIADALLAGAAFLGWSAQVSNDLAESTAALDQLGPGDGVVVLSHDRAVDAPALRGALAAGVGYVGALGSRHTQAARRDWLTAHDVSDEDLARIHGPAGLDIGSRTPPEITVAILAEMLAVRSRTTATSLSRSDGPIHSDGLHAPPPRHPV